jgi:hypothetical protein
MPRPLTKSPALTIRVDLDTWQLLQARADATGRQPREVAQDLVTKALSIDAQVEAAKERMTAAAGARKRGRRGITRTPHVDAP